MPNYRNDYKYNDRKHFLIVVCSEKSLIFEKKNEISLITVQGKDCFHIYRNKYWRLNRKK